MKTDPLFELAKTLSELIPEPLKQLGEDSEKQLHAIARAILSKMDLVTREEFDVQTKVLSRTREKLHALEVRVKALEDNRNDMTG